MRAPLPRPNHLIDVVAVAAVLLAAACATSQPPDLTPAVVPPPTAAAPTTPAHGEDEEAPEPAPVADAPKSNAPLEPIEAAPTADGPPATPDPQAPADLKAPPADAARTPSGLVSKVLKPGSGTDHPGADDTVKVLFSGWMTSGVKFESSAESGHPAEYVPSRAIRAWAEGLPLMVVGEKRRFWVPGSLAYGDSPRPYGMPYGPLVYDIELISFRHPPGPPVVPPDLAAAPPEAKRTPSGLAYRVLEKGSGKVHPRRSSVVEVHYSGWTLDGKMFDSSVTRGETASFPLNNVIRGWTEGLQLMVVGERTRFWIPAKLAYGDKPLGGGPSGPLVFDVELIDIKEPPRP
jgi:FKBP-type peptidyl-prolyl cis-trans isomerase